MQDSFKVESDDEKEIMEMVKKHGREKHGMEMSDEEIKSNIKEG